jgi:hypothetical protein
VHVEKRDGWILKKSGDHILALATLDYVSTDQHLFCVKRPNR